MSQKSTDAVTPPPVLVAREGAVAILALNEPAKRNALTMDLRLALREALDEAIADPDCRAIVLTGAGGAFCSGGDLSAMRADDPMGARRRIAIIHDIVRRIAAGPKPVIAAVEGAAFGAGLALAAASDVVVADPGAKFCASFAKVGLMPDAGLIWSLPPRVGLGAAKRMMLEAPVIGGEEAKALGLVDMLAPAGSVRDIALARARDIARLAPLSIAMTKAAFARGTDDLDRVLACELDGQPMLFASADHQEGRHAFAEKRDPQFRGA
ncbi:enoyl-CoA hydratase/isomerase family protein [Saliniramus sp.]|uniref:enoyl-CoA hydratase/isomerase family protein n=1 Tax=Saliniramus sp. TaxID=2986772 RepID=UPI002C0A432C|nr:enoyl-CoA hydratase/isomerase family protein [Saliniramus sp.]HMB10430.1 enoyl-CoA hydratase/isomerase family protein [Saliniramus sp.]